MLGRRNFIALSAGMAAWAGFDRGWSAEPGLAFYASTGPDLTLYTLDVEGASLTPRATVRLPANVQYAWPHPSRKYLYVVASNGQPAGGPTGAAGRDANHYACAYRVDPASGALTPHGEPRRLPVRPLHVSVDRTGRFLLVAYNHPSGATVHHIAADGTIGAMVSQPKGLDFGIFAHQIRTTPSNRTAILVTRGNNAMPDHPEDPGAIKIFSFDEGRLANLASIAPGNGLGFGPRHLDFHPTAPFVYVSLERENALYVYGLAPNGILTRDPLFRRATLTDPGTVHPGQGAGPIHVHPNGRFVYQTNRGSGRTAFEGRKVWNGGENSVVVWSIDEKTGAPTAIQHIDTHGFEPRTFTIDPAGRVLLVANITPMPVRRGEAVVNESAGLSVYRIGDDGKLSFVRKYDVDTRDGTLFWCGLLTMA